MSEEINDAIAAHIGGHTLGVAVRPQTERDREGRRTDFEVS